MLDVRRLRLLRELKIRGTLAEVAEALQYSPSSVSQQLALLEKEAGVELLRKTGRRVQLTPQAEVLVAHTAQLLETLEQAEADLAASLTTVTGTVRIAVFQSAALALMPDALTRMAAGYPEVRIEMIQREPETALHETWARDFDLVIAEQYPGHAAPRYAELDRVRLTTDAIRLAVPPPSPGAAAIAPGGHRGAALGDGAARRGLPALGRTGLPERRVRARRALRDRRPAGADPADRVGKCRGTDAGPGLDRPRHHARSCWTCPVIRTGPSSPRCGGPAPSGRPSWPPGRSWP